MTLSLRALGLLTILQPIINDHNLSLDKLSKYTSDKQFFIENALKELVDSGKIRKTDRSDGTYHLEITEYIKQQPDIQSRINGMFRDDRTHSLIAWFLYEIGAEYNLDEALRDRVLEEYNAARTIQFWGDDVIIETFKIVSSGKDMGMLRMQHILDALEKRDRGE